MLEKEKTKTIIIMVKLNYALKMLKTSCETLKHVQSAHNDYERTEKPRVKVRQRFLSFNPAVSFAPF